MHSGIGCLKILQIQEESRLKYLMVGYGLQQQYTVLWTIQD